MKTKKVKEENMEINPYEVDKLARIPSWLKILLLKYWAAAAACFLLFGISELGVNVYSMGFDGTVKLVILLGLFMAVLMNYILRPIVRLMYNRRNNTYRWNMINMKGLISFGVALIYNLIISIIICILIVEVLSPNHLVFDPFGTTEGVGIEPLTVGLLYMILDGIFLSTKNLIIMAYQRSKYNNLLNRKIDVKQWIGE